MEKAFIDSPLGILKIEGDALGIAVITMLDDQETITETIPEVLEDCAYQLNEYFEGKTI